MSINCTDRDGLEKFMKESLNERRYIHSLGVQDMASHLAKVHGADIEKAEFAGRYHDIAKCFDQDTMDKYVKKYGLADEYLGNPALAHSKVAAEILKNEYGVDDVDVLNAVSSHTTGRAGMSLLEEIVYVSDAIEDNRNYPELKKLQKRAETDLDGTCLFIMDYTIDVIKSKGRRLDTDTIDAREWIFNKINNK